VLKNRLRAVFCFYAARDCRKVEQGTDAAYRIGFAMQADLSIKAAV